MKCSNGFDTLPVTEQPVEAFSEKGMLQLNMDDGIHEIGVFQHIGERSVQQDSYAYCRWDGGILAVVADGMGGLKSGEKVSSLLTNSFVRDAAFLKKEDSEDALLKLLSHGNLNVNRMLGRDNLYKSGSTVVAVLVEKGTFQWISVGDSRIYLHRDQSIVRLNREHVYKNNLRLQAVNGKISFDEISSHQERDSLTSFVGMGELRYIDFSEEKIPCRFGDRLLLVSDGVFKVLSDNRLCQLLSTAASADAAADQIGEAVLSENRPDQDNLTVLVMDIY